MPSNSINDPPVQSQLCGQVNRGMKNRQCASSFESGLIVHTRMGACRAITSQGHAPSCRLRFHAAPGLLWIRVHFSLSRLFSTSFSLVVDFFRDVILNNIYESEYANPTPLKYRLVGMEKRKNPSFSLHHPSQALGLTLDLIESPLKGHSSNPQRGEAKPHPPELPPQR